MIDSADRQTPNSDAHSGLARIWQWIIGIDADVSESEQRQGQLLNLLALTGVLIAVSLLVSILIAQSRGYVGATQQNLVYFLFPMGFIPLSLVCMVLAKRGRVQLASRLYVWLTFGAIAFGAAMFNGYQSASWLLMIWPVALAGSLLHPIMAHVSSIAAALLSMGVLLAQRAGLYTPVWGVSQEASHFYSLAFGWIMLILGVGLTGFLNARSLTKALADVQSTSADLATSQSELEQRVAARTAELLDRAEQFRVIAELQQAAASATDLESLLSNAVGLIARQLGFDHVGIFLLDAGRQWALLRAASSAGGGKMLARGHQLRVGQQGIVGYVAEMGVTRYASDVSNDAVWLRNSDLPETTSEIALPLIVGERVIGVLDIQTQVRTALDAGDIETLRVLADGVGVAIENVRRFSETQDALARLERYQEEDAIRAWRHALSRRHLQVGYTYRDGATEALAPRAGGLGALIGTIQHVTREQADDGRHMLYAPINVSGNPLGVLSLESISPWSDEAVRLVENVVNQLDLALTNARLLEETRLRATQEAARGEIVGRIRALNSTDAILRNAAEELGRALQVEKSRIQLVQFGE